jgi:predicted esterase
MSTGHDDRNGNEPVKQLTDIGYGFGQSLDIYRPQHPRGEVGLLLWHGSGPNERDVMEPLARSIATAGVLTIVPDWNSGDGGRGRHHLCASLAFVRDASESMGLTRLVLVGWSLSASAGLDVIRMCTTLGGWRPDAFVGISGGFDDSPYSEVESSTVTVLPSVPLLLIHGSSDEVVPVERSRSTLQDLRSGGWDVELREVDTDHAGTIGTVYDFDRRRCLPADDPHRRETLATIGEWIAGFALKA